MRGREYANTQPYVLQWLDPLGNPDHAAYVRLGAPLPLYPQLRPVLASFALSGLALSAAGFITATETRDRLETEDWREVEPRELAELQTLNQAAFVTAVSAGALGLSATAWWAWSFR